MEGQRLVDPPAKDGEMFRLLAQNVKDYAIFVIDPEGRVRSWSQGAQRLLGYLEEEIIGRPASLFFTQEDIELGVPQGVMRQARETGRGEDDRWHVRKDGSQFWCSGVMTPLRDEWETLLGFAKIMRDRTDWWRAFQDQRESEVRKAAILEAALDCIISVDHDGNIVEFNPAAERTFGYTRSEVLGREMTDLIIPPSFRDEHRRGMAHYLATGIGRVLGRRIEVTAMRADGTELVAELTITRISTSGAPVFTAFMRDISERKEQEQEIAERRRLADFGRDVALALTKRRSLDEMLARIAEECLRYLDEAFVQIWTADEAGAMLELRAGAGRDASSDGPQALIDVGQGQIGRIALERRPHLINPAIDGERLPTGAWAEREGLIAFAGYPLIVEGWLVGVWAIFARQAFSEAALEAMTVIADGIAGGIERNRAEDKLRAAKEEAEQANRAKDQFLAVLSHELRTPLNPILLAATAMLERPPAPDEMRSALEIVRQNVNIQARLIDDLLDVMWIVRGKLPLHWEVADAHALIGQSVVVCQSEISAKDLRLEMNLEATGQYLNADPARFQQVLWNLLKNAVKFTPRGGRIAIRTHNQVVDGNERLVIEFSDTGIGIEPAVLPLIFDPFQQGETRITRKFGGLGLGLAICRGIVDAHDGTLIAESEGQDRGTTFRITMKTIPSPTATDAALARDSPTTLPPAPSSLKLLVVEDEPATLKLMARLMTGLGHEVTTAGTVADALDAAGTKDFDLIVSDIGLPDASGLELMRQIVARIGPVPAIALTGYGMEEDILRSRAAGFSAHLTKPIDFAKLEALIRLVTPPQL